MPSRTLYVAGIVLAERARPALREVRPGDTTCSTSAGSPPPQSRHSSQPSPASLPTLTIPSSDLGASATGPIHTLSAQTLPHGAGSVGVQVTHEREDAFPDQGLVDFASRHVHAHSSRSITTPSLGLSYGLSDRLTLGVRIPYLERRAIRAAEHLHDDGVETNQVEDHGDARGIGDMAVVGKYRFLHDDARVPARSARGSATSSSTAWPGACL